MNTTVQIDSRWLQLKELFASQKQLLTRKNRTKGTYNGIYQRYRYPVITAEHIPMHWRFELNETLNPLLLERLGINATFNPGAILFNGKVCLVVRVEGNDRKSFFAVAESENGIDNFHFWEHPIAIPHTENPDTNVYDMRLTQHEDGWIYGLFCTERRDPNAPEYDQSSAIAQCGIARTTDLKNWERLPDLQTKGGQQRNVVLHPEFVEGKYALYTRPQDGFIEAGKGGGIGWGVCESMENAVIEEEKIIDPKVYHTIKEVKNGQGPAPIKTAEGWLHLAHGVRNTAAGLRYVLYMFMTALDDPSKVIYRPGGHFMAPLEEERIGDVSNVLFTNGWVAQEDGSVLIYYASSDTRCHVAMSTVERLVDYCINTPEDHFYTNESVNTRSEMIERNLAWLAEHATSIQS